MLGDRLKEARKAKKKTQAEMASIVGVSQATYSCYERGTITPLGVHGGWPIIADERVTGTISIGGGGHGVGISLDADELLAAIAATRADVTDPE